MNEERTMEIKTPDSLLLLEINTRVYSALETLHNERKISKTRLEVLKMDKDSLVSYKAPTYSKHVLMAKNLIKKIDYILENSKIN